MSDIHSRLRFSSLCLASALALFSISASLVAEQQPEVPRYAMQPVQKKLIHFGWAEPQTLEQFQVPLEYLDETCPVDGIGIRPPFVLKRNGKAFKYPIDKAKGSPVMLTHEDFAEWIPALRRLQQTRLKHNFILLGSILFNADWFDDAAWERTMNNFETMAWLARESQFEGICLDLEAYRHSGFPFQYNPKYGHSLAETQVQVRKRAAEWIARIERQFPNLVLFTFFWTSHCDSLFKAEHPESEYQSKVGLQSAFFNGVYDAVSENVKIIDGSENNGYHAAFEKDYLASLGLFRKYSKAWIDPKNHAKYDRITQLSMALYLDSYIKREKAGHWNHFEKSDNPTQLLYTNIGNCLKYSDEYAWIWAERGTFWPKVHKNTIPYWNDRLPFAREAIEAARDMDAFSLKHCGKNVLINSELIPGKGKETGAPGQSASSFRGWSQYQDPDLKQGTITAENGMVRIKGCGYGCLSQGLSKVKLGQKYVLTAKAKVEGEGNRPSVTYFFRNAKGQGLWSLTGRGAFVDDKDGWKKATLIFAVPDNKDIATMTVTCGTASNTPDDPNDKGVLFDDIELKPVKLPWEN